MQPHVQNTLDAANQVGCMDTGHSGHCSLQTQLEVAEYVEDGLCSFQ